MMNDFVSLKRNLKKDISSYKVYNIGVMGDTPTQLLCQALKGMGVEYQLNLNIVEAEYNQIDQIIYSDNYQQFNSVDAVLIFESTHKLLQKYNKCPVESRAGFATQTFERIKQITNKLHSKVKSTIIYCNFVEEDDCVFGQFASKVEDSFLFQLRKINYQLQDFSVITSGLYICDLSSIQNIIGRERFWDAPIYANTEMVLSLDALPFFANSVLKIINSLLGKVQKCIILDLDNTIWGGVIGDDGIDNIQVGNFGIGKVFTEFQYWLKKMKQRGVLLAVCSKNSEDIAKAPFMNHPEMVLRLTDIAIFIANWESKPDNINTIQKKLNIGFDSMVFLDDNPYEREIVRQSFPDITIPDLPEDPALYLDFLTSLNLFEVTSIANEDSQRTNYYQTQESFHTTLESFSNVNDFLKSINMSAVVRAFDTYSIPRVAQLSQRSNQFNLRTIRYTEEQLNTLLKSNECFALSFNLEDKFGDNGLIAAIILRRIDSLTLFIDSWFMSCRVLKRGMEDFIMNTIVNLARENGFEKIQGEYIQTDKNLIVKDLLPSLGFVLIPTSLWECKLIDYVVRENHIKLKI
jgi:FkbH-like protein